MNTTKKYSTEKCERCGKKFERKRPHQRFCCPNCRWEQWSKLNPRIRLVSAAILLFLLLPSHLFGADWYRISQASIVSSSFADVATSYGHYESNPLLRSPDGRFGMRGLALKAGLTTGTLCATRAMSRKHRRWATVINFAATGLYTYASIHNTRLR